MYLLLHELLFLLLIIIRILSITLRKITIYHGIKLNLNGTNINKFKLIFII